MADDDDHEIGRQVVGTVGSEVQPAYRAVVVDFQEGAKQLALAAAWAAPTKAALERGPHVALLSRNGISRPDPGWRAHGCHDLPFFGLAGLLLTGLRSFLRGLRPARF